MPTSPAVAVVTGSNKGLGLGIIRGLCQKFKGDVYLTSRDVGRGELSIQDLRKEGLDPKMHQLDITEHNSIERLRDFLVEKHGGLDLLINNAAMAYKSDLPSQKELAVENEPLAKRAELTLKTNFWGTLDVCNTLFPILHPHARVVNISGRLGLLTLKELSIDRKTQVLGAKTIDNVKELMIQYFEHVKAGIHKEKGWAQSPYGMSKLGVTAMSIIQQDEFDKAGREDIIVNACSPGSVKTDMSPAGALTIDQGAVCPLYCALLPHNVSKPRGKFIQEMKEVEWQ